MAAVSTLPLGNTDRASLEVVPVAAGALQP
jgi:hypothetical protein